MHRAPGTVPRGLVGPGCGRASMHVWGGDAGGGGGGNPQRRVGTWPTMCGVVLRRGEEGTGGRKVKRRGDVRRGGGRREKSGRDGGRKELIGEEGREVGLLRLRRPCPVSSKGKGLTWILCGNAREFSNARGSLGQRSLFFFTVSYPEIGLLGARVGWRVRRLVF